MEDLRSQLNRARARANVTKEPYENELKKTEAELSRIENSRSSKLANAIALPVHTLRKPATGKSGRS